MPRDLAVLLAAAAASWRGYTGPREFTREAIIHGA